MDHVGKPPIFPIPAPEPNSVYVGISERAVAKGRAFVVHGGESILTRQVKCHGFSAILVFRSCAAFPSDCKKVTERVMSPGPAERIAPINVSPKILNAGE